MVTPWSVSSVASRSAASAAVLVTRISRPQRLVGARDPGERRALSGSGVPFDHHQRCSPHASSIAARCSSDSRPPVLASSRSSRSASRSGRGGGERLDRGRGEAFGDRDDGSLAAAMLPRGAGPVGEHENVIARSERAELIERRLDRRAGRALQRDRARIAGRERRVELRQAPPAPRSVRRRLERWGGRGGGAPRSARG